MLNNLDVLIILLILVGTLRGTIQGLLKQIIGIGSLYISVVLANAGFGKVANSISQFTNFGKSGDETIAFLLLLIGIYLLMRFGLKRLLLQRDDRWQRRRKRTGDPIAEAAMGHPGLFAAPLEVLGGGILGFILTIIWLSILLSLIQYAFSTPWPNYNHLRIPLDASMRTSLLMPIIARVTESILISVSIWVPKDIPTLLQKLHY